MKTSYITTPIYYVNDKPHIGHCYTSLSADIYFRHKILSGLEAKMLTGTDEHGQKIEKSAEKNNVNTMEFCNEVSKKFKELAILIDCACSYEEFGINKFNQLNKIITENKIDGSMNFNKGENFIRTTEGRDFTTGKITNESLSNGRHIKSVIAFWNKLKENGWIYKGKYSGWYAIRDEAFYAESEIVDGKAPSGAEVEWKEEECYFFKLSRVQKFLLNLYRKNKGFIKPYEKYTEVLSFVSGKKISEAENGDFKEDHLEDLCISRPNLKWGIPVPNEENQTIYVWLDALVNYCSALGYPDKENYLKYWRNRFKDSEVIHVVGKDIIRFHCVYWPAFLIAEAVRACDIDSVNLDDYRNLLPDFVFAHGWWTNEGEKISKSLGNVINPFEEIEYLQSFGITKETAINYFRYFLFRAMPFGNDGDYSRANMIKTINSDLANNIGNLVQRCVSMIVKYKNLINTAKVTEMNEDIELYFEKCLKCYDELDYFNAINNILSIAKKSNEYIEEMTPWGLVKENKIDRLEVVLTTILRNIQLIGILLQPIIPHIASKILQIFKKDIESGIFYSSIDFSIFEFDLKEIDLIDAVCLRLHFES